tara:strand:- start:135 stop:440 length:306 start_codon:yes stop_codon:yes gene_type:complete
MKELYKFRKYLSESITENNNEGLRAFIDIIASQLSPEGMDDQEVINIDSWDELFQMWSTNELDFYNHTQSDILDLASEVGLSDNEIGYIMDLPEVDDLERG